MYIILTSLKKQVYHYAMRILIVEDEHRIANTITKGLEQEHYAVDVAYTGTTGFDFISTEDSIKNNKPLFQLGFF